MVQTFHFLREKELLNDDMLTINWSVGFKRRRMLFKRPTGKISAFV